MLGLPLMVWLAACSTFAGYGEDPPAGVDLSGTWKLDPAHSTDTRATLDQLQKARTKAQQQSERELMQTPVQTSRGRPADPALPPLDRPPPPDIALQIEVLRGGDWLRLAQRESELTISNGDTSHSFTAGAKSVVSVPSGVADQRSGWKGREFHIDVKPQLGPRVSRSFQLSTEGKLVETIDISREGHIPALHVIRVYAHTNEEMPQVVPGSD
jgi:hypothetical protein